MVHYFPPKNVRRMSCRSRQFSPATILLLALFGASHGVAAPIDFESQVLPLLAGRCVECHNPTEHKGGLDLSSHAGFLKGGDSGAVFDVDNPLQSELLVRIRSGEMPPEVKGKSQRLSAAETATFESWLLDKGHWPEGRIIDIYETTNDVRGGVDWWSLQPVRRTIPPNVLNQDRVKNPIDAFVLHRLERDEMFPAPMADKRVLIRRAYFDLHGLPPTPANIVSFLQDDSPDAYEQLIDSLLDSPHYGERWARHWLDVVRFAETCGYERDQLKPGIWKYRDWVINAFNSDMSFDQFVTEQLAGDEIPNRTEQSVIATGMLRAGTWNDEPNDAADYLYTRLEDMVHTTTSAFIGLTVKCARCHDHKFDPIRQTDYYRTASFFWPGYIGQQNLGGPDKDQLGYDVFGWTDRNSHPEPIHLLIKGERERPGDIVEPGFLSAVQHLDKPLSSPAEGAKTTQRRLQFARWITDKANPLTARVFVNRLWQHHFGQALVRSPNNFGFKGELPTHPQLLDWLAAEFMDGDWKIKRMQKLMMMSATYRQSSLHPADSEYADRDVTNKKLWRFNRRRLEAEAIRDSMLAASGQLHRTIGGPSFYPKMSEEALDGLSRKANAWQESSLQERSRRSIYMMTKRSRLLPLMTTFDFSDTTLPCGKRDVTTVAPQALALLNNHFVHRQSEAFARRVLAEVGSDPVRQVQRAWQLAVGRDPSGTELEEATKHIANQVVRFGQINRTQEIAPQADDLPVRDRLTLWLRADRGLEMDGDGKVLFWRDHSSVNKRGLHPHDASQAIADHCPVWTADGINGQPAIRFDGEKQFLHVAGTILSNQQFTLIAVATHQGKSEGPRELISNWHRLGRSTSSIFLGTDGESGVRFSDSFAQAGSLQMPQDPFILTAISSANGAVTFQNGREIGRGKLSSRDLSAPYVIGTQGNYQSEWWQGDIAEMIVYDRALTEKERTSVWQYLANRYRLELETASGSPTTLPELALASLCHVLFNTNEFVYID